MNASKVPHRIHFFSLFISLILLVGNGWADSGFQGDLYYVRFDIRSSDHRIERSNLLMVPAHDEFRAADFSSHLISGTADNAVAGHADLSIEKRAEHNAIKVFLERHGLESVKSRSATVDGLAHAETVVSYEGAILLPYRLISSSFDSKEGVYSVSLQIQFAPLAYPDKWPEMAWKHRVEKFMKKIRSFFE